jgi:hypothetical protein
MKRKRDTKLENLAQAEAFRRIQGDEMDTINLYAADFRSIITEYERAHDGEVPTADELLWIESRRLGHNITD